MQNQDTYYIFNTKNKSKVYEGLKKLLYPKDCHCILILPETLKAQLNLMEKCNLEMHVKILICDNELPIQTLISELKKYKVPDENIIKLDVPDYNYLYEILAEHNIPAKVENDSLAAEFNKVKKKLFKPDENYFIELCHEFYYLFVKNSCDLKLPKVKIIEEMEGCLLFSKSKYNKISDNIQQKLYNNLLPMNKSERNFSRAFAGNILLEE